jgi:ATP-dependent Clp protease ATP-binding subunit ClpC
MHRFPVLVWEDWTGSFSARLVDDEDNPGSPLAGFGPSAREALSHLKEYLVLSFEREPWRTAADFHDPRITEFRVEVRPEYQVQGRVYPCDESIPLRVAAVHGRQESGMLVCALPMLSLQFYYYESNALRGLVTTYVQEALKGQTPQQLSRYLFPKRVWLEEIAVAGGKFSAIAHSSIELPTLKLVADPLNSEQMRRSFSRAYGRERQVNELAYLLVVERANVLLVGEVGVGKSSILVVDHLVDVGFNSRFGARPLQRAIEQEIVTQLAFYLNRKSKLRATQLTVDFDIDEQKVTITEGVIT